MPAFEKEIAHISSMLESNGYGVRDGKMPGDNFRLFLTPPGFEVESEEIFKLKEDDTEHCGAVIILGGEVRESFFKQDKEERSKLRVKIENATGVEDLDFFEISDDGKDFKSTIITV